MAALTDLTWAQLADALEGNAKIFVGEDPVGNIGVLISVPAVNGDTVGTLTDQGVVKFLLRLREAARAAQETANQNQTPGEMLDAFPAAVSDGIVTDGYVNQTSSIKAAIKVTSATDISGQTS